MPRVPNRHRVALLGEESARHGKHFRQGEGQVGAGGTRVHRGCRASRAWRGDRRSGGVGSPITIVMITSLTGEGSSEFSQPPSGFNARIALQNAEGGVDGHKINGVVLDDQTSPTEIATAVQDALSKNPVGHRVDQPAVLPRRQVPPAGGHAGDRRVLRRAGVGRRAVHEHVRLRRGQRQHQVPGEHLHRRVHEGARRHGRVLVRLRDLAVVEPVRRRHQPVVRARGAASPACWTRPSPSARWP